ncbi:MAG: heavy-metal-associated domain-containing protein [Bacteroidales bacterium]|nr:heavy-metal-associated domain-containing protein [Bacteroidales bacterium]MCF8387506.1 heavy-metal-associated domain-containing protein [Bacteroidales bacterium]MCF8399141.1 heavy-metal-associated domain-containing protein [Bacteroidales bacterium]
MKTIELFVDNIKCHGCANTIQREMKKFEHVKDVRVEVERGAVIIDHEGNDDLLKGFTRKLKRLGYPEQGKGGTSAKVKSYVSCAIGRMNN